MNLYFILLFFALFLIELGYFKIANKYGIIDKPNHRSSHNSVTIRGGGIIFSLALLIISIYLGWHYIYFIVGLLLISIVSFIDDLKTINNKIRLFIHLISAILLLLQLGISAFSIYGIVLSIVFIIGTINAVNFMDGINGVTGGFGLITAVVLLYINTYQVIFTESQYLVALTMSLLVFNFFNFRTKAKCFAGDVGSVGLAFILLFFLLQLIIKTSNINYILLFLLYGLDTSTTMLFRLIKKENVFEAHRQHFYQFLANGKKIPHLIVSCLYIFGQLVVNIILIKYSFKTTTTLFCSIFISIPIFILIRFYFEGSQKLLNLKQ